MPEGHDAIIEVSNIMSFVLYTQILKQSVLKPASPGITLNFEVLDGPFSILSEPERMSRERQRPRRRVCVNKNFNLGHNFQTIKDKAFILHMCIPCDKTFHMVP